MLARVLILLVFASLLLPRDAAASAVCQTIGDCSSVAGSDDAHVLTAPCSCELSSAPVSAQLGRTRIKKLRGTPPLVVEPIRSSFDAPPSRESRTRHTAVLRGRPRVPTIVLKQSFLL